MVRASRTTRLARISHDSKGRASLEARVCCTSWYCRGLLRRCVIAGLGVHVQRGQTCGWLHLYPDLPPLAIVRRIRWAISQHVLIAELDSYLGGDFGQFSR